MPELKKDQIELVTRYEAMSLDDLLNLVGNLAAEFGTAETTSRYVLGMPNVFDRGSQIVADVRTALCKRRAEAAAFLTARKSALEPLEWVAGLVDILVAWKLTGGIPPIAMGFIMYGFIIIGPP